MIWTNSPRNCGGWQNSLEIGKRFAIQIAGERIFVPARATYNIEHERSGDEEEIEFQIKWSNTKVKS